MSPSSYIFTICRHQWQALRTGLSAARNVRRRWPSTGPSSVLAAQVGLQNLVLFLVFVILVVWHEQRWATDAFAYPLLFQIQIFDVHPPPSPAPAQKPRKQPRQVSPLRSKRPQRNRCGPQLTFSTPPPRLRPASCSAPPPPRPTSTPAANRTTARMDFAQMTEAATAIRASRSRRAGASRRPHARRWACAC